MRTILLAVTTAAAAAVAAAQTPAPKFVVASLRVNRDQSNAPLRLRPILRKGGRVSLSNQTLLELIRTAYGVDENEVIGGPGWIRSTAFDLEARGTADMSAETALAMLRDLLADRFSLAVHREPRERPLYSLTVAARDGQPSPRLRPSADECAPAVPPKGMPPPPPPRPDLMDSIPLMVARTPLRCPSMVMPGHVSARTMSMDSFAIELALAVGRPVVNRTGLTGQFDLDLDYSADLSTAPLPGASTVPELTTAIQEQLGLKLDPQRGLVDVLVIDRVMTLSEN